MVQNIEEFTTQLHLGTRAKLPDFRNREIPLPEGWTTKDVASHVAKGERCRRSKHRLSRDVTASCCTRKTSEIFEVGVAIKLVGRSLPTRCHRRIHALLRLSCSATDHVLVGIGIEFRRLNVIEGSGRRPVNVAGRSGDVPAILEFTAVGSTWIVASGVS
jgi:hypothetical protein